MLQRIESFIREQGLIEPGGEVTCLVSGGADSTCLWHALRSLGYRVTALHVAHGAPVRYLLLALEGKPPVAVLDGVDRAKPFRVDVDRVARAVEVLEAWAAAPAW